LLPKGIAPHTDFLKYKYGCGYGNSKKCTWYILVYMAKQTDVPSDDRPQVHITEPWQLFVPADKKHINHDIMQVRGPDQLFVQRARDHPEMLSMTPPVIS